MKEMDGVYKNEFDGEIYTYRTRNKQLYSNEEFINFLKVSEISSDYYGELSILPYYYVGDFTKYPRNLYLDEKFLFNVRLILEYTKSEKEKQAINSILNECLIIDKEPVLKNVRLGYNSENIKELGEYHINGKLKDAHRDAINRYGSKLIKKFKPKDKKDIEESHFFTNTK